MFDIDRWVEIWVTITRNKTRSLLTGFGVFWGILMLVILLGSGNGFKNGVLKNVDGFSTNSAFFFSERTGEPYKGYKKGTLLADAQPRLGDDPPACERGALSFTDDYAMGRTE